MQKYNRLQIAVSEKNAKTIRKMYVQWHKNVIRNVKGKDHWVGMSECTIDHPFSVI